MSNKVHPKNLKPMEFILNIEPKDRLTYEQDSGLFRQGIEKIRGTNIYTRKSTNFLTMFLTLDSLENELPFLGLREMEYTLTKKEKGQTIWKMRTNQKEQTQDALLPK